MNKFMTAGAALLATTTMATAGGLDRSGQSITAVFEDGNYVELSYGYAMPSVTGVQGVGSGNMADNYGLVGLALKHQVNDQLSFALIFDQPFGAAIDYRRKDVGYPVPDVAAEYRTTSITALARYEFNDRISVYAGPRYVQTQATITAPGPAVFEYLSDSDVGYVVGAAYEIPDIALRASLTYSSETSFENERTLNGAPHTSSGAYTLPQSVNLDFQTGIAADTLLMASVRWVEWTETTLVTPIGLIDYDTDSWTYSVGVGRRFSDALSGSVTLGYEEGTGADASNLAPTDGNISLALGAAYNMGNGMELSGGVRYVWLGDATTELPISATFEDNHAVAVGLKVAYNF